MKTVQFITVETVWDVRLIKEGGRVWLPVKDIANMLWTKAGHSFTEGLLQSCKMVRPVATMEQGGEVATVPTLCATKESVVSQLKQSRSGLAVGLITWLNSEVEKYQKEVCDGGNMTEDDKRHEN